MHMHFFGASTGLCRCKHGLSVVHVQFPEYVNNSRVRGGEGAGMHVTVSRPQIYRCYGK